MTPRIDIPETAKVGEIIEIKTLIRHSMLSEPGSGEAGTDAQDLTPLKWFVAKFNNQEIFRTELTASLSANPYISFFFKVSGPGDFLFLWAEESGRAWTRKHKLATQ